ncbi:hypothetical protein ACT17_14615 [Mycolicibacterium conceptionense]|uniref:Uncharacterized protein n=1 Tax=Mycolicibacterium conceptionense TaxID=451644 RepID=A0A0J8U7N7_9MYCO|nr:hypothetical protein [Mycolicibacterium conceptionense]KMV17528.1 hypothetical protein ACT17_14615 [Mycolicibacterium conceptionense]
MSDYTPTRRVPANELRAGDIVNAKLIFEEWPSSAGLLSPLEDDIYNLAAVRYVTIGAAERHIPDGCADLDENADVRISWDGGSFFVEANQEIQVFEERTR